MNDLTNKARVRVVGCGRWSMGDDQVGLLVARRLQALADPALEVRCTEEPLSELADETAVALDALFVVDAAPADDKHPAGAWTRLEYDGRSKIRIREAHVGAHGLGVGEALEVAARLGWLPPVVHVYVAFGNVFDRSLTASEPVAAAVLGVTTSIVEDIRRLGISLNPHRE